MRLCYLEARKGILRRFVMAALGFLVCLNLVKIGLDYQAGEIREVAGNRENMRQAFMEIYNAAKGDITQETAGFVTQETKRLEELCADGTYSRDYTPGTYCGYLFGDYFLIHKYFYLPMQYCVSYEDSLEPVLERAEDNLEFYTQVGNKGMAAKSAYILEHYAGRSIRAFYLTDGWEHLLSYGFSDLLILLLLLLGVSGSFSRERETDMLRLLQSTRNGKGKLALSKCVSAILYAVCLTVLFAAVNFTVYGILCGFEGLNCPLYAIESYRDTPFSGTILEFYLLATLAKAAAFSQTAVCLSFLSSCFRRTLLPCLMGAGVMVFMEWLGSMAGSFLSARSIAGMLSPLSLTHLSQWMRSLHGFLIGAWFFPQEIIAVLLQLVLTALCAVGIWFNNEESVCRASAGRHLTSISIET